MTFTFKPLGTEIKHLVQEKKGAQNDFFLHLELIDGTSKLVKVPKDVFEIILKYTRPQQL